MEFGNDPMDARFNIVVIFSAFASFSTSTLKPNVRRRQRFFEVIVSCLERVRVERRRRSTSPSRRFIPTPSSTSVAAFGC